MLGKLAELFIFGLAPLVFGGLLMPGAMRSRGNHDRWRGFVSRAHRAAAATPF